MKKICKIKTFILIIFNFINSSNKFDKNINTSNQLNSSVKNTKENSLICFNDNNQKLISHFFSNVQDYDMYVLTIQWLSKIKT